MTSRQTPSTCTVSTTGQTAACPCGLRATSTASSRVNSTRSSASSGSPASEPVGGLGSVVDQADTLAVVPAPGSLQHHRPADLVGERRELLDRRHDRPAWAGDAELGQPPAHDDLVLGVLQGVRAGADDDALGLQGAQVLGRHVLVVEGQHVAAGGESAQGVEVVLVADLGARDDERGAVLRVAREHPQRDAEPDRRCRHHPGELSATHDAHHREPHGGNPNDVPTRPPKCTGRRHAGGAHPSPRSKWTGTRHARRDGNRSASIRPRPGPLPVTRTRTGRRCLPRTASRSASSPRAACG